MTVMFCTKLAFLRDKPNGDPLDRTAVVAVNTQLDNVVDQGNGWLSVQTTTIDAQKRSGFIPSDCASATQPGSDPTRPPAPNGDGKPQSPSSDDSGVPNSYPKFLVLSYAKTTLPMSDLVSYLNTQGDISKEVKIALYIMWVNESARGKAGINNNYGGFQADVGHWPSKFDDFINGTCVKTDNGGHRRRFLCFTDWQSCVAMFKGIIVDRGLYVGGTTTKIVHMSVDTPERWGWAYYREWVTGSPSAIPSSDIIRSLGSLYHEAETALGATGDVGQLPVQPPGSGLPITAGDRATLINIANTEGNLRLVWNNGHDPAEKYLAPLRPALNELQPVYYEWCAAFVTWCCRHAGYQIPDQPSGFWATMAYVDSWKWWAAQNGTLIATNSAGFAFQAGDILLFQWHQSPPSLSHVLDHIGICVNVISPATVSSAEGNTDKPGQTDVKTRNIGNIAGVIRLPR